jgi:hypothetical protein
LGEEEEEEVTVIANLSVLFKDDVSFEEYVAPVTNR